MVGYPSLGQDHRTPGPKLSTLFFFPLFILAAACSPQPPSGLNQLSQVETGVTRASSPTPSAISRPVDDHLLIPSTSTPRATDLPPSPTAAPSTPSPTTQLCQVPGEVETRIFNSRIADREVIFRIYLPPCYGQDGKRYPTLYMFHGSIQDDSHWDLLGLDEAAEQAILSGKTVPFLIVMPNGGWLANNTSGGAGSFEALVTDDLIPYVENNFCAWAERAGRAIGGLSRGGYWALEIAFRHTDMFRSVGGHSAALLDIAAGPALNPQHTGLNESVLDLRIYLDIGKDDYVINNIMTLHEDMAAGGIPHVWHLNDGAHEDSYWSAHVGEYIDWYGAEWPLQRELYPPC